MVTVCLDLPSAGATLSICACMQKMHEGIDGRGMKRKGNAGKEKDDAWDASLCEHVFEIDVNDSGGVIDQVQ